MQIISGIKGQIVRDNRGSIPKLFVIRAITASYEATLEEIASEEELRAIVAEFYPDSSPGIAHEIR